MAKKKAVEWGFKKIKKLWEGLQSNKETVKKVESQIKKITKENIKKKKFAGFTDPKKLNTAKNRLKKLKAADQKRINILKKGGYAAAGTTAAAITLDALLDKVLKDTPAYTIKKGDTLSEIARDNGTTLKALKEANPQIKDLNKISIGQKIKMPGKVKDRKSVYQGMTKPEMAAITKRPMGGKVYKNTVVRKHGGQIGTPRGIGKALRGYGKGYK
jgi:LysM repeat protein|tara:strand:+ start:410 stop:1054 length:645 start_codon:yes stop_codon:yes gene_type:complete